VTHTYVRLTCCITTQFPYKIVSVLRNQAVKAYGAWGWVCVDVRNLNTRGSVNLMLQDPLSSDYWRGKVTRAPCCDKNDKRSQTVNSLCEVKRNGIYAKFHENSSSDFTSHYRVETRGRMN